ncbi:hypothetical protein DFJ74DRAFT_771601 [Hyaloraphidium curvatum]|nr:hypothetical protein DFJ74DRAFT_771601 [Hyaloraphidium curvatum]
MDTSSAPADAGSAAADPALADKILKQVEFYFSDANLARDKFLWKAISDHPQGWVPLDTLLTFNRLRALSSSKPVVAAALRASKGLLEVDAAGDNVRRGKQLQQKPGAQFRTIFAEGFPMDLPDPLAAIEAFFSEAGKVDFVKVFYSSTSPASAEGAAENAAEPAEGAEPAPEAGDAARPPRGEKRFSGQCFVEFADARDAKKAKERKWEHAGNEIRVVSKADYIAAHPSKPLDSSLPRPPKPAAQTLHYLSPAPPEPTEPRPIERNPGRLIYCSGVPQGTGMDAMREAFRKHGWVEWVAYRPGETSAFVLYGEKKRKSEEEKGAEGEGKEGEAKEEDMKEAKEEDEEAEGREDGEKAETGEGDEIKWSDDAKPEDVPASSDAHAVDPSSSAPAEPASDASPQKPPFELPGEDPSTPLAERVLARIAKDSGEEGKVKIGEATADVRKATEFEEPAFFDDYEAQVRRIFERKQNPRGKKGQDKGKEDKGKGGRGGGGGGGGRGKRKGGHQGGGGKRSKNN